jgi:branched-subunit amino acid ABC-type transport system permease component
MDILVLQIFNSLFYASVLFLIAAGLSLIFGVMRIVNMAHSSAAASAGCTRCSEQTSPPPTGRACCKSPYAR